jgi:hypothetical protein
MAFELTDKKRFVTQEKAKVEQTCRLTTAETMRNKNDYIRQCEITKKSHTRALAESLFNTEQ